MHKIVRESINMNFKKYKDLKRDLDIGVISSIQKWMEDIGIDEDDYKINDDLSIDVFHDVNLVDKHLKELPEYINFNKVTGGFYAAGNNWKSLRGFPKEILGDLQLRSISLPKTYSIPINFDEEEIRKSIKVYGKIYK